MTAAMKRFTHTLHPFGAEILDAGRARFRLWAPELDALTLELSTGETHSMSSLGDGWFELECEATYGTGYRYRIDDKLTVPDPASRMQNDDVHDWSVLVDSRAYEWMQSQWLGRPWHEVVIYELHVGCCGGFAGVMQQLPMLAELGVTAIELMPIGDFPGQRNWGYDGVLPFAPDTAYDTPTELKALIDKAHELGLCVYLDVVYNHFGPDGNYLHAYAPNFFSNEKSSWGDRINFSQPYVREYFTQNALYWLHEYRFDGLRFDAVHAISDPGWLDEMAARVRASTEPGRHIHLMLENENNCAAHLARDFNAQWNDDWHNVMHVLLTGEREGYYANYCAFPERKLARSLSEGFVYQGEPSPTHANQPRGEPSAFLPPTAFINFLQNHDQIGNRAMGERLTSLADARNLRAAITLQLLMPAIPLLFMGEPWQTTTPFLFFTDFHGELAKAVREGRAREFEVFAAFKDEQQRARIPDPNARETFVGSNPHPAGNSIPPELMSFYRELLSLRQQHIVQHLAQCRALAASVVGETALVASWLLGNGARLEIAVNFSDVIWLIDPLTEPALFTSVEAGAALAAQGKLAPHCAVVTISAGEACAAT